MITLYAYPFRTRAERILWLLQELNLEHEVVRTTPRAIKKINPLGKVPAIAYQGEIYTESLAIMEFLVSLTPRQDLIPTDSATVYRFRNFIYYLLSEVEAYLWIAQQASSLKAFYTWPEGTLEEALGRVTQAIPHSYSYITDTRTGYVCTQFTLADIYAYHVFTWAQALGLELPETVLQYISALEQRPSFPAAMKNSA